MNEIVIVLLAAGASRRMGQPKQLLPLNHDTLLGHAIRQCRYSGMPVVAVLGAGSSAIETRIANFGAHLVFNPDWREGMSSSIRTGLQRSLQLFDTMEGCILTVCDQPFVSGELYLRLLEERRSSEKGIVACRYSDTLGTPCLFGRHYFPHLLQLEGDRGARGLLQEFRDDVAAVSFEKGTFDLDSPEEYQEFLKHDH